MRLPRSSRHAVALALVTVAVCGTGVAVADYSSERAFVVDMNTARAHHGLRRYVQRRDLTAAARRWARWMAAHRTLAHNPSLGSNVCCWRDLGENVGRGPNEPALNRAFMASREHRSNILSRTFTQVGVGTARGSDGRLYVDELFRRPASSSSAVAVAEPAPVRGRQTRVVTRSDSRPQRPSPAPVLRRWTALPPGILVNRATGVAVVRAPLPSSA